MRDTSSTRCCSRPCTSADAAAGAAAAAAAAATIAAADAAAATDDAADAQMLLLLMAPAWQLNVTVCTIRYESVVFAALRAPWIK